MEPTTSARQKSGVAWEPFTISRLSPKSLWHCPGLKERPHRSGDLVHFEMFANSVPDYPAWLPLNTARCIALRQKGNGIIEPQQFDERTGIPSRVVPATPHGFESQPFRA